LSSSLTVFSGFCTRRRGLINTIEELNDGDLSCLSAENLSKNKVTKNRTIPQSLIAVISGNALQLLGVILEENNTCPAGD